MKGDLRALPSEEFALRQLGLNTKHCIKSEEELLYECNGFGHIPEGIFKHPQNRKVMSVEVKRIVGNSLPKECGGRYTPEKAYSLAMEKYSFCCYG